MRWQWLPTTIQPTQTTNEPSQKPWSHRLRHCPHGHLRVALCVIDCYNVEISPSFANETQWFAVRTVTLVITFRVSGIVKNDCVEPKISLSYETIEYDKADHLSVGCSPINGKQWQSDTIVTKISVSTHIKVTLIPTLLPTIIPHWVTYVWAYALADTHY